MPPAPIPSNEAERLAALRAYDVVDSVCEEGFDTIAWLASRIVDVPIALVTLVEEDRQWFKAGYGIEVKETPRDQAFCAYAILNPDQTLIVEDATKDPRFADNPLVTGPMGIRFYAGVPLVSPGGYALGTLCVIDSKPRVLSEEKLDMLAGLAHSVVTALELRRVTRQVLTLSLTDSLTGLPNRATFLAAVEGAIAMQQTRDYPFGIILFDIEGIEEHNSRPCAFDEVLTIAADVLRTHFGERADMARMAEAAFGILVRNADRGAMAALAERARTLLEHEWLQHGLHVTLCIGGVAFPKAPQAADDALSTTVATLAAARSSGPGSLLCRSAPNMLRLASPREPDPASAAQRQSG